MRIPVPAAVLVILVGVGAASYWGVADGLGSDRRSSSSIPTSFQTTVYFLTDGGRAPLGMRRALVKRPPYQGASLRAALASLLAGPTRAERRAGMTTALPRGTRLRSLSYKGPGGTDAVVDLHGLPIDEPAYRTLQAITQIGRTVIGLSGISRVWLRDDGKPWGLRNFHGRVLDVPYDYAKLLGFNIGTPNGMFSALP